MILKLRAGMLVIFALALLSASTATALAIGQQAEPAEPAEATEDTEATKATEATEPAEPAAPAQEADDQVKFIKMYVEEWKWTPNLIRVPVGTKLRIEFLSYGATRRFDLKAYKLKVKLPQDKPVTVEFVADKKGEFKWRCGRPCGDGCAKLTGKLIVE
jgi:heme/copper-type cytochrome/quinol oxidase subunit 2